MCNLYSITTNQVAIINLFRVINRYVGNLAPMPGVFLAPCSGPLTRRRHCPQEPTSAGGTVSSESGQRLIGSIRRECLDHVIEDSVGIPLPFVARVDAVVIIVPDRRSVAEHWVPGRWGRRLGDCGGVHQSEEAPRWRPTCKLMLCATKLSPDLPQYGALCRISCRDHLLRLA
jgi:hypothetical protein